MSDNNEPLDLQKIEERLKRDVWRVDTLHKTLDVFKVTAMRTDCYNLVAEIKRLKAELAEAKRTQVKDGGRGQLRPFPEPDGEE